MRKIIYLAALSGAAFFAMIFLTQISTTWAAQILEKRYPPPGRMVPVGDYKLQLYCFGAGSPTIIVEPGMGVDWVSWRLVISKLLPTNRVCVYDRAGYGWSDPGPKPRTALLEARELHTLLVRAGVPPPYLLAAHSFGAYIARIYASKFRGSLAGVVLVDPSQEDEPASTGAASSKRAGLRISNLVDLIPPLGVQRLRRMYKGDKAIRGELRDAPQFYRERYLIASSLTQLKFERNEFDSLSLTKAQVRETVFPRDLPLTVITAMHMSAAANSQLSNEPNSADRELQARLAHSSQFGRQILAWSGHMVPLDEPELIVSAVEDIIHQPNRPETASR
jgi:pimeloyl-ACP methyl ester carboxylesterase